MESTGFRSLDEGQRLEFDTEPARETPGGRRTRNLILTVAMYTEPPNSLMGGSGLSMASAHRLATRRRIQAAI